MQPRVTVWWSCLQTIDLLRETEQFAVELIRFLSAKISLALALHDSPAQPHTAAAEITQHL